jgi:hypothetical protein
MDVVHSGRGGARMRRLIVIVGLMTGAMLVPAQAQFWGHSPPVFDFDDDELSPRELSRMALAQGFRLVSRPRYGDEYAVATAQDRSGRTFQVTLDIFSGQVLNARALAAAPRPPTRAERVPERPNPRREAAVPPLRSAPRSVEPQKPVQSGPKATPDRPTVIRREPLLPSPPAARATPQTPSATAPVGSGTQTQPRRIEIVPPSGNSPSGSTPPL